MKNSKYSQFLNSLIDDQIPSNLDLAPKILSKIQMQKGAKMNRRKKVLIPTALVILMMSMITVTVPAVADTLQRWIGYIPGFGQVQDNAIRTLSEPQTQTVDGITLSVNEVTASTDKTMVKYSIIGIKDSMLSDIFVCPMSNDIPLNASPEISLSDGSRLTELGVRVTPGFESDLFEATYSSPIPAREKKVTFSLECLWQTGNGSSIWRFEIPLRLTEKGGEELTVAPVIDIPTQEPEGPSDVQPVDAGNIEVNQVIPLTDGYILQGSLKVDLETGLTADIFNGYLEDVTILDANGVALVTSMVPIDFIIEADETPDNQYPWALQVNPSSVAWPLTITVNSIPAVTEPYAASSFQVDVGEDPQPGQEWIIDKDVSLGPKMLRVVSIKRIQNDSRMNGYEITFIYDSSLGFSYDIVGGVPNGGGGIGGGEDGQPISIVESYIDVVPTGLLTVQLNGYGIEPIRGPWQVVLNEPVN
jgi:hypothetical protein